MKIEYPGSLHNHTMYSNLRLRDCIIKENDLIDYAIQLGHKVIAITDHESISNAIKVEKYYNKIKKDNPDFKVILGNEIYLCRNGLNGQNFVGGQDKYYHFVLLAKDAVGHQQIRELSTRAWMRSYMSRGLRRVPTYYQDLFEIIGANRGHVIGSTACLGGAIPTQLLKYKQTQNELLWDKIVQWINQMDNLFGHGNFFLELQPSENKDQTYVNRQLIKLSKEVGIPYIITTDTHYLKKEDRFVHKAYLNAQDGDREVDDFYATTYLMDTQELESHMDLTEEEFRYAYQNILNIYDMCEDYSLKKPLKIPQLMWKDIQLNKAINYDYYISQIPYLTTFLNSDYIGNVKLGEEIINVISGDTRLQTKECYDEVNACLEMTWISSEKNKAHWSAYYLNLQKIIEECWKAGTLIGPGRGSGVGFILLYLLEITQINPLWETTKTFRWRFLNPDRVSVLDVDIDIEGGRRGQVLDHLRKVYGSDRVSQVATFGTEKAKSAILTACRGLGIDVDIAQYLSSLIEADRGQQRSLKQTFYGDEENGMAANKQFVKEMTENYPEVWKVAQKIEGVVCRTGIHAGGVIFVDEPFTNSTALMRAPDGTIITQFDLHDCEDASLIKYDLLSVEALDKMHICLDLLSEQGYIEVEPNLKDTYEKVIGIYNLERTDKKMWQMTWRHEINSLFQMEQQSGIQGIALTLPESVDDLATLNSVIRLMAQEKGAEQPLSKFARFKKNVNLWYEEMAAYGLTKEEQRLLEPVVKISYGICESQEGFMQLVQMPECGGFDLTWADRLRKSIAKKNPAEYEKLQKEYFEQVEKKGLSKNLCNYVWNVLVATSRGYGFNKSHTLAYSLIALQEMNLAFKFPTIFWNCACLISDSGGGETDETEEENREDYWDETVSVSMDNFEFDIEENEDNEDEDDEIEENTVMAATSKKKTKTKTSDYDKVAKALGQIQAAGIRISPPDINLSGMTFKPIAEEDKIIYGIKGITRVGDDLIKEIIAGRPYSSLQDFMNRIKINKLQMVNLIKSGAFDCFGDRTEVMKEYILSVSDQKKRLTLQNMAMLIEKGLLPPQLQFEIKVFNFNKYLKKNKIDTDYLIDEIAFKFYEQHYDCDLLFLVNEQWHIKQSDWDKIYKKAMDPVRDYLKANGTELLATLNNRLYQETYDKYATGSLSKWEMDSICYYNHEHELAKVNNAVYELANFHAMPEGPMIDRTFPSKDGKTIPIYKTFRFAGTVLGKDKNKGLVTLLTTTGVVSVRIFKAQFAEYDKQISRKNLDGTKTVIEKSWFSRGSKLILNGFRRGNDLVLKKYKNTPYPVIGLITKVTDDGLIEYKTEREEV